MCGFAKGFQSYVPFSKFLYISLYPATNAPKSDHKPFLNTRAMFLGQCYLDSWCSQYIDNTVESDNFHRRKFKINKNSRGIQIWGNRK